MKAIRVEQYGDLDALRYEDIPDPEPGEGEARVEIEAAGVNFVDIYHRMGRYPRKLPITLGMEGAGVIDVVGPGVDNDTALVHAAAGGVGHLLVQLAKRCRARVIGTVSTQEKAELCKKAGADEIILYTQTDFEAETKRLTGDKGVDVVYDSVGKTTFQKSLNCLRARGYLVLYGQSSGPVEPLDPQVLNAKGSLFLTRPSLGHYAASREEITGRANDLFTWISSGELEVHIDQTFPLSEAAKAHRYMEDRRTKGKILLLP
ncbi:MAG: quinone oxidoreductase [Anaerolineales bacterium]